MPGYFDIDDFLAQEELVTVTTQFDFSYLAHLDENNRYNTTNSNHKNSHLPEATKLRMPIWSIHKWADLGFIRLNGFPKHYNLKTREWLQADPAAVTLSPNFFHCGRAVVDLVERSSHKLAASQRRRPNVQQLQQLEALLQEAAQVRTALVQTYTGNRLRHTLNWSLSSHGDDVTAYLVKLTDMELRLFRAGAVAASSHNLWKVFGSSRLVQKHRAAVKRPKQPTANGDASGSSRKKQRFN
jgi:hypothetical protein